MDLMHFLKLCSLLVEHNAALNFVAYESNVLFAVVKIFGEIENC